MDGGSWSTVALLGVACVAALVALRALGRRESGGGMRVVSRLALEPRRSLVIVEVGARHFLVGVGEGGLTMLSELRPEDVARAEAAPASARGDVWARAWRRVIGGRA